MKYQFEDTRMPCFSIPNRVVDGLLNIATGAQLKVLMYLWRYSKLAHETSDIARFCNISPEEVESAIGFWVKENVFALEQGKLRLISAVKTVQPRELPKVRPTVMLEETNEEFRGMVAEIQRITGKIINQPMLMVLYNMTENLRFSYEMTVQMAAYCNSVDKFSARYLETMSIEWHDDGINTFEQAEQKIRQLEDTRNLQSRLKRAFGITTNFSAKQREMLDNWVGMGLTEELIIEAYNRCMDHKGKMTFAYMNRILENWGKLGYKKVADIREEVHTGRQQHTGLSELEKLSIGMMQGDNK